MVVHNFWPCFELSPLWAVRAYAKKKWEKKKEPRIEKGCAASVELPRLASERGWCRDVRWKETAMAWWDGPRRALGKADMWEEWDKRLKRQYDQGDQKLETIYNFMVHFLFLEFNNKQQENLLEILPFIYI